MSSYLFLTRLQAMRDEVSEIVSIHANTRADDDQYEDPEEWWACPLLNSLNKTIEELEQNL